MSTLGIAVGAVDICLRALDWYYFSIDLERTLLSFAFPSDPINIQFVDVYVFVIVCSRTPRELREMWFIAKRAQKASTRAVSLFDIVANV